MQVSLGQPTRKSKVMAIDDSELALDVLRDVLEDAGFDVVTLGSALGASAAIVRERPDLVLLDVSMPALTGDRLTEVLRKNPALQRTMIVLYSDRPTGELEAVARQCGADGFIHKTTDHDELVRQVQQWLARAA